MLVYVTYIRIPPPRPAPPPPPNTPAPFSEKCGRVCRLEEALWADTAFLSALGVMDYSLLMGVDRATGQLVVGIIDFVRQVQPGPCSGCLTLKRG